MKKEEYRVYKSSFASDNNSGVHPVVLNALKAVNEGHVVAYGDDPFTAQGIEALKREFGEDTEAFFVFNGTGANVSSLASVTRPYQAIICAGSAHINVDECCSPERITGCKLLDIQTPDGKITPDDILPLLSSLGDEHQAQPAVVSITQATEYGTVYRPSEIQAITRTAHENGLLVQMDGARLSNAAASLGCSLKGLTGDLGVDILSFGGTKNGLMYGEAVVFFTPEHAEEFRFFRKQTTQLASKMRFIAAQFTALLDHELWRANALHANRMATLLSGYIADIPEISLRYPVEANAVFVSMPMRAIKSLLSDYYFYYTGGKDPVARFMTSFDTREEDVLVFAEKIRESVI